MFDANTEVCKEPVDVGGCECYYECLEGCDDCDADCACFDGQSRK